MSDAETLRRAVELMRHIEAHGVDETFMFAVANWLEYVADQGDRAAINHRARALAVARAYLSEESP